MCLLEMPFPFLGLRISGWPLTPALSAPGAGIRRPHLRPGLVNGPEFRCEEGT